MLVLALYTAIFIAIMPELAFFATGIAVLALFAGFASAHLSARFGRRYVMGIYVALFVSMLAHIPVMVWFVSLDVGREFIDWTHEIPGFMQIRQYGYALEVAIACGTGLFVVLEKPEKGVYFSLIIGVTVLWAALCWSGGRGAIVSLGGSFFMITMLYPKMALRLWGFVVPTAVSGAVLSIFIYTPENVSLGLFNGLERSMDGDFSSGRVFAWGEAVRLFFERPLMGHGMSQFSVLSDKIPFREAHNLFLDSLLSIGALGTVV